MSRVGKTATMVSVPITIDLCLGGRELSEPKLDPSGRFVAFGSTMAGPGTIMIVDLDGDGLERQLSLGPPARTGRGAFGGCFDWHPDGGSIVYAATDGWLWRQHLAGGAVEALAGERVAGATIDGAHDAPVEAPAWAPDGSFVVFMVGQAEIWMQPADGRPGRRIDDALDGFCFDPAVSPDGRYVSYQGWSAPDMAWDGARMVTIDLEASTAQAQRWRPSDDSAVQQPHFLPGGTPVCVHDGSGWLNVATPAGELVTGGEPFEHARPTWGPGQASYACSPDGSQVAVARNEHGFGRLCAVDVAGGTVREVATGVHNALSWAGHRLAALRTGARTPTEIVVYDTRDWARRGVAAGPAAGWGDVDMAEPELVALDVDGTSIPGRLYRSGASTRGLLCWIHGGPTDQWPVTFMPRFNFWLAAGWDVLVPDHRGSTGHGRVHQQALHGGWGATDVADTAGLLGHVQTTTGASPETTLVVGGSAGGMTVIGLLIEHPALVAGGMASSPVTDLVDLADRSHRFEAHYTDTLVAPRSDVQALRARSPLSRAASVARPLLLMHGTDDPVVPIESTVEFAGAVRRAGGDVELHVFDGEGHGFRQHDNKRREYELMTAFADRVVRRESS